MINKTVGYSGFRTYGQLPYPTRKQGKELEIANKVWQATSRQADYKHPLENYHNNKTVYSKSYIQNTFPQNYHPQHVPKGGHTTLNFNNTGVIKAYDREEALKYGAQTRSNLDDPRKANLLKAGTQHWRSVYQQSLSNQAQNNVQNSQFNNSNSGQQAVNNTSIANGSTVHNPQFRSSSLGGKTKAQIAEQISRQNSYKVKPYINNAKTGVSDYKFNYGQKIGDSPFNLMQMVSLKQPLRDHPLKRGTNQLWTQIPNYQGFKPSQLSFKQYQAMIQNRNQTKKGDLKLQTSQNFLVQVPGYGGFKPQSQRISNQLRDSCLSTK